MHFHTSRLSMRLIAATDLPLYRTLYCDAATMRYIGPPLGDAEAKTNLAALLSGEEVAGGVWQVWVMQLDSAGRDVGLFGLHLKGRTGEVGVVLVPSWRRNGLATEVMTEAVEMWFRDESVDAVIARHHVDNTAARHWLRKLAFVRKEVGGMVHWHRARPRTVAPSPRQSAGMLR